MTDSGAPASFSKPSDALGDSDSDTTTTCSNGILLPAASTIVPPSRIGPYIQGAYVPRSIPPPKISLRQPDNNTTGFVIDKIMMPRDLPEFPPGHTQTVAIYYVGYRDKPLARGLVPYDKILEHVSLRELEEWEDKLPELKKQSRRENRKAMREERKEERQRQEERQRERDRLRKAGGKRLTRGLRRRLGMELDGSDNGGNRKEKSDLGF
ncbi:hypothetical protein C8A03DRAFT_37604 [Achaetomium macrosporum]|uniref:Uncharacterized protein n=1 Tax=Achaetomium macrosporum TaxID=79813 RepID=A0AAN7C3K3_9PEZI|nr:hypothetical protein C8A03DRAFT_37604 [Achaetomium macrosporum]